MSDPISRIESHVEARTRMVRKYGEEAVAASERFADAWAERLMKGEPLESGEPRGIFAWPPAPPETT